MPEAPLPAATVRVDHLERLRERRETLTAAALASRRRLAEVTRTLADRLDVDPHLRTPRQAGEEAEADRTMRECRRQFHIAMEVAAVAIMLSRAAEAGMVPRPQRCRRDCQDPRPKTQDLRPF